MSIKHWFSFGRQTGAALGAVLGVALLVGSCGDPQVPTALSTTQELVVATEIPLPPTATPTVTPTPPPTPVVGEPTPVPVAQPGLSPDLIRLAVIFDDETGGTADQLFSDAWLGARAWEHEVNSRGGLGGRLVQVVPIDSRLFDNRAAIEQVCAGDFFAIIGSHSLGDADGAELLGTEDCMIADFAGQVYGSGRATSEVTFLSNPFFNDVRQAGPARYLVETFPDAAENLGLLRYFALDLTNAVERQREMLTEQGMQIAFDLNADLEEDLSERIVGRWAEEGAESLVWTADPGRLIDLLEALDEPPTFVLCEWGCYSQQFLLDGGEAIEGVYTWIPHSPIGSPNARGDIFLYQFHLATVAPDAGWSEVSLQSWMSGRLFETAYARLIQAEPEAPKREQLITAARSIDFFTANGILPGTNPADRRPNPCFVLMVVRNGRWEQEHPVPPRDKDCAEENLYELVSTASVGVPVTSSATSESQPATEAPASGPDLENPEDLDE